MKVIIKMGFRNLFRNKRRSLLTSIVIGLGLAAIIITDGYLTGMNENMVRSITTSLITEGQIHHPKFRETQKVEYQIQNVKQVKKILASEKEVKSTASRVLSFAMISSPKAMKNIMLFGVEPGHEIEVSTTHKQLIEGEFVVDKNSLVIGQLLLQRLHARIGDKIVLTVAKAKTGDISQEMFRISGIIKSGSKELDEKSAFIHIKRAQNLLGIGNSIHEIALKFHHRHIGENTSFPMWNRLKETGNAAESWKQIVSGLVSMMKMTDQSKAIIAIILMVLVALGIINTLFMALYERMFEFAVLRALGTKGREIVLMIVSEAGSLSILSIGVGLIIAVLFAIPLNIWGVNYSGVEFAEVTFREPVYFRFAWHQFVAFPLITFLFTLVVSFYPAIHAGRIKMSKAMKRSL